MKETHLSVITVFLIHSTVWKLCICIVFNYSIREKSLKTGLCSAARMVDSNETKMSSSELAVDNTYLIYAHIAFKI